MPKTNSPIVAKKSPAPRPPVQNLAAAEPDASPIPGGLPADAVAAYAYHIWEQEGRPVGRDREHWLQAEAQLRWALLADDLNGPRSQNTVRRKLWDQSVARFGPGRRARRKRRPAEWRAR
jgi:hypothetical protein